VINLKQLYALSPGTRLWYKRGTLDPIMVEVIGHWPERWAHVYVQIVGTDKRCKITTSSKKYLDIVTESEAVEV
jgi:predicted oxidoreductase